MCSWKALKTQTRREIKAFIVVGGIVAALVGFLSMFVNVYPWQLFKCADVTQNWIDLYLIPFISKFVITILYLLILASAILFSVLAHGLSTRLHKWIKR